MLKKILDFYEKKIDNARKSKKKFLQVKQKFFQVRRLKKKNNSSWLKRKLYNFLNYFQNNDLEFKKKNKTLETLPFFDLSKTTILKNIMWKNLANPYDNIGVAEKNTDINDFKRSTEKQITENFTFQNRLLKKFRDILAKKIFGSKMLLDTKISTFSYPEFEEKFKDIFFTKLPESLNKRSWKNFKHTISIKISGLSYETGEIYFNKLIDNVFLKFDRAYEQLFLIRFKNTYKYNLLYVLWT